MLEVAADLMGTLSTDSGSDSSSRISSLESSSLSSTLSSAFSCSLWKYGTSGAEMKLKIRKNKFKNIIGNPYPTCEMNQVCRYPPLSAADPRMCSLQASQLHSQYTPYIQKTTGLEDPLLELEPQIHELEKRALNIKINIYNTLLQVPQRQLCQLLVVGTELLMVHLVQRVMKRRKPFDELSRSQAYKRLREQRQVLESIDDIQNEMQAENESLSEPYPASDSSGPSSTTVHSLENSGELSDTNSLSNNEDQADVVHNGSEAYSSSTSELENSAESDGISSTESLPAVPDMKQRIGEWVVKSNISREAANSLLKILRDVPDLSDLPKTRATLVHTPTERVELVDMPPGKYHHFGLRNGLLKSLQQSYVKLPDRSVIKVMIGVYEGVEKPPSPETFLRQFVDEVSDIAETGINYKGKNYTVIIDGVVCDLPAKSYVLNTKGHTGEFSCTKCEVQGEYIQNRTTFFDLHAESRTDASFRSKRNKEHHHGDTPLTDIPVFDMIRDVVVDSMHQLYMRATKKIFKIWFQKSPNRLHRNYRFAVSQCIQNLRNSLPCEFDRRIRNLDYIDKYKATEWRVLLLYVGVVSLQQILDGSQRHLDFYVNFLTLHVAATILSKQSSAEEKNYAKRLLENFNIAHDLVNNSPVFVGREYLTQSDVYSTPRRSSSMDIYKNID
ncbi:hypothetical protein B566_EDAN016855 [Ephemera danica]|nr:hypothetical protein B566_EDAN016855 [Ephemera danica]